jgi:hypothetical protein
MAKSFKAEYTVDDVIGLYRIRSNEGDEGAIRTTAAIVRDLIKNKHSVNIPAAYRAVAKEMRTGFVGDAAHRITSSLVAKQPVIHITPKDEREEYKEAANVAERFDTAMLERFAGEFSEDIVYNLTYGVVADGESVLKVAHRPQAWANYPKRASDEPGDDYKKRSEDYKKGPIDLPVVWRDVDRTACVFEGGEYGDNWAMEYGEYEQPYLQSQYKMAKDGNRLINPRTVLEGTPRPEGLGTATTGRSTKLEFFTADEWHVIIDGSEAPGFPKRNPYSPYIPYFRAKAFRSQSLLYSLLFLVPRLDELLTMKLNWAYLGSYPNPIIEDVPNSSAFPGIDGPLGNAGDSGAGAQSALVWTPGKAIQLPQGKTMKFLEPPAVGKDLNELVTILKGLIDIAGVPSVMRGVSGAQQSGYNAAQMKAAAAMAYKLAALSCQRQLEKATEFTHWLIEHVVKQTVYVRGWSDINPKSGKPTSRASQGWLGLSPDTNSKNIAKLSLLGPVSYQYRPQQPTDFQADAMVAMQLTNSPNQLYSVEDVLEKLLQEEDPKAVIDRIWLEKALRRPEIEQIMMDEALRQSGMMPAQQPQNPLQAAGILGPNGQPLLPPGPNNLQPVPLANQAPPGVQGVPGVTMPIQPSAPQGGGIPGNTGGREAGMYPGMPGGMQR